MNDFVNKSCRILIDESPVGSGVHIFHEKQNIIVTAKHCLVDDSNNLIQKTICIQFWDSLTGTFTEKIDISHSDVFWEQNFDMLILKAIVPHNLQINLLETLISKDLPEREQLRFSFTGYPFGVSSQEPVTIHSIYNSVIRNEKFKIEPTTSIEANSSEASSNVKNFSGSGVWFEYKGKFYLSGIVSEYEEKFKTFTVNKLTIFLPILLAQAGLPSVNFQQTSHIDFDGKTPKVLKSIFESQLIKINEYISNFKALTALDEIEDLQTFLNIHDVENKEAITAECLFLKAISLHLLGNEYSKVSNLYFEANKLNNKSIYEERLLLHYFTNGDIDKLKEIIGNILTQDPYNPRAWSFKDRIYEEKISPFKVQKTILYKLTSISIINSQISENYVSDLTIFDEIFNDDYEEKPIPTEITFENIGYWLHFSQYVYMKCKPVSYTSNTFIETSKTNGNLEYANTLFEIISKKIEDTEAKDNVSFKIATFFYHLTSFFITQDKSIVFKLLDDFLETDIKKDFPFFQTQLIFALNSIKEYERIIHVINSLPEQAIMPNIYSLCAEISQSNNEIDNYKYYFFKYLDRSPSLSENDFMFVISGFENLIKDGTSVDIVIKKGESVTNWSNEFLQNLFLAFIYILKGELHSKSEELLDDVVSSNSFSTNKDLIRIIGLCYWNIRQLKKAKDYFKLVEDKLLIDSNFHFLSEYIELLRECLGEKLLDSSESLKLLSMLKKWRELGTASLKFTEYELGIANLLGHYQLAEEVACFGRENFKDREAFFIENELIAIHQQKRTKLNLIKIDNLVDNKIFNINFSDDQIINIIGLCFEFKKTQIGIELFYRLIKRNPNDTSLKMKYVFNGYFIGNDLIDIFPTPLEVEIGVYLKYELDGKEYLEEVDLNNYSKFPFKKMIGKKKGELFKGTDLSNGKAFNIKIIEIFNKYLGLKVEIFKEMYSGSKFYDGVKMGNIKYNKNGSLNIEDLHQQLFEITGFDSIRRKQLLDELLVKYRNTDIGFFEFANFVGCPIRAFNYLLNSEHLLVLPIRGHAKLNSNLDSKFHLDFTSLILFYKLSSKGVINFSSLKRKFFIAPSILGYINQLMLKNDLNESESFSLIVEENGISRDNSYEYNKHFIEKECIGIFEWLNSYCEIATFQEQLETMVKIHEEGLFKNKDLFTKSVLETLILAMNKDSILVSDDSAIIKKGLNIVSSEFYLKKVLLVEENLVTDEMIGLKYRSITINTDTLWDFFKKDYLHENQKSNFNRSLNYSLTNWNPNPDNLRIVLEFLKKVFLEKYTLEYKGKITELIFSKIIISNYIDKVELIRYVNTFLNAEFAQMELQKTIIKNTIFKIYDSNGI